LLPSAFEAGIDLLATGGLFHLVGLYERAPLPLSGSKMMGKRLVAGCVWSEVDMPAASARALCATNSFRHCWPACLLGSRGLQLLSDRCSAGGVSELLASGEVGASTMITHHFPWSEMVETYSWLHDHPDEAGNVVFDWDEPSKL